MGGEILGVSYVNAMFDLYKEQLQQIAKKWFETLQPDVAEDARLVQKGMLLYRQRQVYQLKLEGGYLFGSVQDVTPVKVKIHLSHLSRSECTCPAHGYCRHQLAVFLTAYNEIGSVEELIEKWRQPLKLQKIAQQFGLKKARDLMKQSSTSEPNYDQWIVDFSNSFTAIIEDGMKKKNPFVVEQLFSAYMKRLKTNAPTSQEWKHLYLLVGALFTFKKLISFSEKIGFSETIIRRYYQSAFIQLSSMAEENVQKLNVHSLPFSFDVFIDKLRVDSTELLTVGVDRNQSLLTHEKISFYFLLWSRLFKKSEWKTAELTRLKQLMEQTANQTQLFIFSTSYLQLLFMNGKDGEVLELLQDADHDIIPYVLVWITHLRQQKNWKRLSAYLLYVIETSPAYVSQLPLDGARAQFAQALSKEARAYCSALGRFELYEKMLIQLLPYSFHICNDYYFDIGNYEKWVELMTYGKYFVHDIDPVQLKIVEKKQPAILLPIFHQSIQYHLELRNRENYREAVKQLKKLQSLYRKLGSAEKWETFFQLLLENTRRLRAFHEECRIGRLIV